MALAAPALADYIANMQNRDLTGTAVVISLDTQSDGVTPTGKNTQPVITAILGQPETYAGIRTYTSWSFLVDDGSGAVDVYSSAKYLPAGYTPKVGDNVTIGVSGGTAGGATYEPYNELPEVGNLGTNSIVTLSSGNSYPLPLTSASQIMTDAYGDTGPLNISNLLADITANQQSVHATSGTVSSTTLPNDIAGRLITLDGVSVGMPAGTTSFGTANITGSVTDSSGGSLTMYYWPSSYSSCYDSLNGTTINPNWTYNVTGIFDNYGGNQPEFLPTGGMTVASVPEPGTLALLGAGVSIAAMGYVRRKFRKQIDRRKISS